MDDSDKPQPPGKPNLTPNRDLNQALEGSSIEELLRMQDQLNQLMRDRYEKQLAVMFTDIAGSTAYFERYGDAEGRRMVQRHNDLLMPIVVRFDGKVVKTIGDSIMATFVSPSSAVQAAIAMQQALSIDGGKMTPDHERLQIRIGLNYGAALVNDRDGDVYGDMVNVAARVQSQAKASQILISGSFRQQLTTHFDLQLAGKFTPKGKSVDVLLYEVQWRELAKPPPTPDHKPDLGSRYQVLELIGSGGMASVWRARDEKLLRDVAIKVLHPQGLSPTTRERFNREAQISASLAHDNIVQAFDYQTSEGGPSFIAMEYVPGGTLRAFLDKRGRLPELWATLIGHEVARALAFAHEKGVIHRDVKPENVLLSEEGQLKLTDFGIAGVAELSRLTQQGTPLGTPAYLSPERIKGETATARGDLYSLGVLMYEVAIGALPFRGETEAAVVFAVVDGKLADPEKFAALDPAFRKLVLKCLAPKQEERFESAAELARELLAYLKRSRVVDPRSALASALKGGSVAGDETSTSAVHSAKELRALIEEIKTDPRGARLPAGRKGPSAATWMGATGILALLIGGALTLTSLRRETVVALPAVTAAPRPADAIAAPAPVAAAVAPAPVPVEPAVAEPLPRVQTTRPARASADRRAVAAQPATLVVTVTGGWAEVRIDGEAKGRTPAARTFVIPAGTRRLELANPYRAPYSTTLELRPGQTLEHQVELRPLP